MQVSIELVMVVIRTLMNVAALGVVAWGFLHWRASQGRDTQRLFEQLDLMRSELLVMSDQVVALQSRPAVEVLRSAPPAPEPRQIITTPPPAARGYEVAARLARSGASCEELISSCGLSRHEAELLLRLHRTTPPPAPTPVKTANVVAKPAAKSAPARNAVEPPRPRSRLSMVG